MTTPLTMAEIVDKAYSNWLAMPDRPALRGFLIDAVVAGKPPDMYRTIAYLERVENAMMEEGPRTAGAKTALRQVILDLKEGKHLE